MLKTQEITLQKNEKLLKQTLGLAVAALFSVITTNSSILGYPSQLNVVIAAAMGSWGILVFGVSLLTYLVTGGIFDGLVQIASMIIILGVKLAVTRKSQSKAMSDINHAANAVLTTSAMIFCSVFISLITRTDVYLTCYRLVCSVLCGCLVYFIQAVEANVSKDRLLDINGINGAFIGAIYVVSIAVLSSVSFFNINLGRIAGIFAVLAMSGKYRHIGGAVCGALTTCGVMLCSPELAKNTLLLATCGLLCGALAPFGQILSALVMLFASAFSLMAVGFNSDTFSILTDAAVSCVLFAAIPPDITKKFLRFFGNKRNAVNIAGQSACAKLKFTSGTIKDVRKRLIGVSKLLEEESKKSTGISDVVKQRICGECSVREVCWEDNKEKLDSVFHLLEKKIAEKGSISQNEISEVFPICKRENRLATGFNDCYSEFVTEQTGKFKINELRDLLSDQLFAMEEMLCDISCRISEVTEVDAGLSEKIRSHLTKLGAVSPKVCVYSDTGRSKKIEVFTSSEFKCDLIRLTVEISGIADCELELPVISDADGIIKMLFCEAPLYNTESGAVQFPITDGGVCGDSLERIWLTKSEFAVVLSDGMGTGKRAKLDSSFTVSLISRFIASEISPETSLRLINSILRVKGWDESFATADIAIFDLASGNVSFIKAGAAPSYILRDEVLIKIEGQAFPIGILSETSPDTVSYKLFDGDRVIITSDGVSEEIIKASAAEMNRCSMNPQNASELIGEYAKTGSGFKDKSVHKDDISVCAVDIFINK